MPSTTVPSAITPTRLGQVLIPVRDIERAIRFYRDTLGLRFLFQAPPGLAFFELGGVRLMLSTPETDSEDVSRTGSILYYVVDDIQGAFASVTAKGAESVGKPHIVARMPQFDLWLAEVRDSEGNVLCLMHEAPKSSE